MSKQLNFERKVVNYEEIIEKLKEENQKLRDKINTKKEVWVVTARVILPFMDTVDCGDILIQGIYSSLRRATLELNKLENGKNNWYCYECMREKNSIIGLSSLYHTNFEANKCNYGHTLERIIYNSCMDFFNIHTAIIDESRVDYNYRTI